LAAEFPCFACSALDFLSFLLTWPTLVRGAHDQEDVVDTVTPERLKYYLDNKETVTIIDLRPDKDYKEKGLPGARSIPIKELDKNLRIIPRRPGNSLLRLSAKCSYSRRLPGAQR
jgi:hypothetical protein